jgi:hypothetical protein
LNFAILVDEGHAKPIDFDFAHVGDFVDVKEVSDLAVKVAHLVFVIDVTKESMSLLWGIFLNSETT